VKLVENREGVARRAILVDMLAPAQPLIVHRIPCAPPRGARAPPRATFRANGTTSSREREPRGSSKKRKQSLRCLSVGIYAGLFGARQTRSAYLPTGDETCSHAL